jgi:guanylate kinase
MTPGTLYIISAPSGAGKTSLIKRLVQQVEQLQVSISHTTRPRRAGELDGRDYFFVSVAAFQTMLAQNHFLEHAQVFDNFYGTSRLAVEQTLAQGIDLILEIDWQGAQQMRKIFPDCRSIFILPPSLAILQQRLRGRGQDAEAVIQRRLAEAMAEISHYHEFDYLVVNDDFDQALAQLQSIFMAHRLLTARQQKNLHGVLSALLPNEFS